MAFGFSDFIEILIKSNTVNFLAVSGIILFAALKLNIAGRLDAEAEKIKNYTESAENEKKDAEKKLEIITSKVQHLPDTIDRIQKSTQKTAAAYEKKVLSDIEAQKAFINKNADRLLNLETAKFKADLAALLSEKSAETARKNALEQLKDNPMLQSFYIDKAIDELDEVNL